jgi:hypothetical protein
MATLASGRREKKGGKSLASIPFAAVAANSLDLAVKSLSIKFAGRQSNLLVAIVQH